MDLISVPRSFVQVYTEAATYRTTAPSGGRGGSSFGTLKFILQTEQGQFHLSTTSE